MVSAGYKQTEVGAIPGDWTTATLLECSRRITDGEHITPLRTDSGYYLLSARNILDSKLDLTDVDYVGEQEYRRIRLRCNPEIGDILISCSGTIGRIATVPAGLECVMVRSAALVKTASNLNAEFAKFYFQSSRGQTQIQASVNQGAQPNLFLNHIQNLRTPLPSIVEQRAIAEALSDADALTDLLENLIVKRRHIKQGAMQELLTGKKRLAGFSGKWLSKPLGELFDFSGGVSASRDQLSTDGICYLHYGDIHLSRRTFVDVDKDAALLPKLDVSISKVSASAILKDGDIVFVDASEDDEGASKHVVISNKTGIPYISGLHTIVAKAKTTDTNPLFRQYCFQTEDIKRQFVFYAVGTKVTGISKTSIAKIVLTYPPTDEEQFAIASTLSDVDAELSALEQKLAKAQQIKQGMMQELLTGRVRLI